MPRRDSCKQVLSPQVITQARFRYIQDLLYEENAGNNSYYNRPLIYRAFDI